MMSTTAGQAADTSRGAALGSVEDIFITDCGAAPMRRVTHAEAVAGAGLSDDRYGQRRGTYPNTKKSAQGEVADPGRQITLIEAEAIEGARHEYEIELDPIETRRNVLTRGVALNHLVGREFRVGDEVVLRGIRLCEPCGHLEKLTREGVKKSLIHRGGLRAEIVRGGTIRKGDAVCAS